MCLRKKSKMKSYCYFILSYCLKKFVSAQHLLSAPSIKQPCKKSKNVISAQGASSINYGIINFLLSYFFRKVTSSQFKNVLLKLLGEFIKYVNVMIVFQVSLNFDPVKEILKMRCHYIFSEESRKAFFFYA